MPDQELFRAVFVRHGHTEYTDIPPDITLRGKAALSRNSYPIQTFSAGYPIHLYTSPKVRAVGSGQYLNNFLQGQALGEEPALGAIHLRQPERAQRILAGYRSLTDPLAVEKAYWKQAEFDNPAIFETRAQVRSRIFQFLSNLVNQHSKQVEPVCYVLVSHVETLCHLIDRPFSYDFSVDDPVNCAEPIYLVVQRRHASLRLNITFRDHFVTLPYNVENPQAPY